MNVDELLLPLALILLVSKLLSLVGKKVGLPQVIGMILAGILIGLIKYIPGQTILTDTAQEGLSFLAKIGVILIMFSAGLGTDLKQFRKTGVPSIVITIMGVVFPLLFGFLAAVLMLHGGDFKGLSQHDMYSCLFYGTVLAATSVSITVAALKELGKLNSKVGTSIIAAAIIDDIIGVILLSLFISLDTTGNASEIGKAIGMMIAFFVAAVAVGIALRYLIKFISHRHPHTRRIPIISFAICFLFAYAAEEWFGVADITGAYVAGLMLAGLSESEYVDKKIEISNYMIFAPVFFANIGITASFDTISSTMVGFGFVFILAGILGKFLGCGLGALACRYGIKDSARVGIGMMVRAEVVLVCAQKGIDSNPQLIDPGIMPFVLILIIVTTLLTPLLLKLSYRKEPALPPIDNGDGTMTLPTQPCIMSDIPEIGGPAPLGGSDSDNAGSDGDATAPSPSDDAPCADCAAESDDQSSSPYHN